MRKLKRNISILLCVALVGVNGLTVSAEDVKSKDRNEILEIGELSGEEDEKQSETREENETSEEKSLEVKNFGTDNEEQQNTSELGSEEDENQQEDISEESVQVMEETLNVEEQQELPQAENDAEAQVQNEVEKRRAPSAVSGLKAAVINKTQVKLTWNSSEGAEGYLIYRQEGNNGKFSYRYMVKGQEFVDTTAVLGNFNFYRVYPYVYDGAGKMLTGTSTMYVYAKPLSGPEPVSSLRAQKNYASYVQLTWKKSANAEGYIIYRKTEYEDRFSYRAMTSSTQFLDKTPEADAFNFYRVYPYFTDSNGKRVLGKSQAYVYVKPEYFPAVEQINAVNSSWDGSLNISWSYSQVAEGYLVYKKTGNAGNFTYCAIVDTTEYWRGYTDKTASYTENNFYKVYPFYYGKNGKRVLGPCTTYAYGKSKLPGVYNLSAYSQIDQVRIQWDENPYGIKSDGYYVYRRQGTGSFGYCGMTKGNEYIDRAAAKNEVNYYRIYPYKMINGKAVVGSSNTYVYGRAQNYSLGQAIADYGWQFIGTPYVWGGNDLTTGVDCSGFTTQVHKHFGIDIPRTSYTQEHAGQDIGRDLSNAKPGDVICYCYNLSEQACHAAIYLGNGRMINSTTSYDINGKEISGIQIGYANYMTIKTIRRFW